MTSFRPGTIDYAEIGRWYDLLPWRERRAGPQRPIAALGADELTARGSPVT